MPQQTDEDVKKLLQQYGGTLDPGTVVQQYGGTVEEAAPYRTTPEGMPVYRIDVNLPKGAFGFPSGAGVAEGQEPPPRQPGGFLEEAVVNPARQVASGYSSGVANMAHLGANIFGLMDTAASSISSMTGLEKGVLFQQIEDWLRQQQGAYEQQAGELAGGRKDLASQLYRGGTTALTELPVYAGAAAAGGPVGGMAMLGAIEGADQGWANQLQAAAEGALMGGALHVMGPASRPIRLTGAGAMTYAKLRLQGADNETALSNALTMGGLSAMGPGGVGIKEIARNVPEMTAIPPVFPNRNPVEKAAVDYLRAQDIPIDVGTASGSKYARRLKEVVDVSPIGALISHDVEGRTTQALRRHAEELKQQATPEVSPNELYQEFYDAENQPSAKVSVPSGETDAQGKPVMHDVQMPVPVGLLKPALKPIFEQMQWMPMADRNTSAGYTAIKRILEGPDFIPASQAEMGLSGIKSMIRTGEGRNRGLAKFIAPKLQGMIDRAAQEYGGDRPMQALQEGRVAAAKQAGADWLAETFGKAMAEGGYNRTQALWNSWQNLADEAKRTMFNPKQVGNLNNFFLGTKKLAENVNPSGTATMAAVAAQLGATFARPSLGAAAYFAGSGALSKLFHSDRGVRLLTEGLKIGAKTPRGIEIQKQIGDIIGPPEEGSTGAAAGGGPPPGAPPAAGGAGQEPIRIGQPLHEELQNIADQAARRIKERGNLSGTQLSGGLPIDPRDVKDMVQWGAAKLGQGIVGGPLWRREMVAQFGQIPRKQLDQIYDQAKEHEITKNVKDWRPGMMLTDIHPLTSEIIPKRESQLTVPDVQRYLQNMVRERLGEIPDDAPDQVKLQRMLQQSRKEFKDQMKQPYSGIDWYGPDTRLGDRLLRDKFPELRDKTYDTLQKAMSAAMSNNSNPLAEAYNGARIWDIFRKTGEFPLKQPNGKNWPAQGINFQIEKLNRLIDELGPEEAALFLHERHPGSEIKYFVPNAKEIRLGDYYPGSRILGPKIGNYFSNIMDLPQDGTAVDVWEMRRKGRIQGKLFDGRGRVIESPRTEAERNLIMDTHRRIARENDIDPRDAQSVGWHYEQELYRRLGLPVKSFRRSLGIKKYLEELGR